MDSRIVSILVSSFARCVLVAALSLLAAISAVRAETGCIDTEIGKLCGTFEHDKDRNIVHIVGDVGILTDIPVAGVKVPPQCPSGQDPTADRNCLMAGERAYQATFHLYHQPKAYDPNTMNHHKGYFRVIEPIDLMKKEITLSLEAGTAFADLFPPGHAVGMLKFDVDAANFYPRQVECNWKIQWRVKTENNAPITATITTNFAAEDWPKFIPGYYKVKKPYANHDYVKAIPPFVPEKLATCTDDNT